ncbi:MAG: DUF4245 family protein [Actinobacteria bacterium]|nr:DUF4245 family protein [Actinomycetota bacterium]
MSMHVPAVPAEVRVDTVAHNGVVDQSNEAELVAAMREERSRKRLRQTVRDMLLSMLVVTGVVALLVLPWNRGNPDPVRAIDPAPVVQGARTAETWPVLAPRGLSAQWRCTSARISTASDGEDVVHLGYVTPSAAYIGVEQSATRAVSFVHEQSLGGLHEGTVEIAGQTWTRLATPDRRSLLRAESGVTYVVTGSAAWPEIEAFTKALVAG